jgi:hypothetical protein
VTRIRAATRLGSLIRSPLTLGRRRRSRGVRRTLRAFRPLRLEMVEPRTLLAAVSGTVFQDLTGDAQGDQPQAGVAVELYADDGDQQFDAGADQLLDDTQTDAGGQYGFDGIGDGYYFIVQQVPAGFVPVGEALYAFEVVGDVPYAVGSLPVDDFDSPDPAEAYVIAALDADPLTIGPTPAGLAGVQRELLVDVIGAAGVLSASGSIGEGSYRFGSSGPAGTTATLTYTAASPVDLTGGGANTALRLDLGQVETGVGEPDLLFSVTMTGGGDTATFSGAIPNNPDGSSHVVMPWAAFTAGGSLSPEQIAGQLDQLVVELNSPVQPDVDFTLDGMVAARPQDEGYDFVNACADSRLSGYVYVDADNDGIKHPNELPIPNTTVTLAGSDVYGNAVNRVATTDAAGFYEFTGLVAGTYTVNQTQPAAYLPGQATPGPIGGTASQDGNVIADVTITGCAQHGESNNFGELGLRYPSKQVLLFPFAIWRNPQDGGGDGDQQDDRGNDGQQEDLGDDGQQDELGDDGQQEDPGNDDPPRTAGAVAAATGSSTDAGAELSGTDGDETLVNDANTGQAALTTGAGQSERVEVSETSLHSDGGPGADTVEVLDAAGSEQVYAELGEGNDSVELRDSAGDDSPIYAPDPLPFHWDGGPVADVHGGGPWLWIGDFERTTAAASRGGTDHYLATVHDHRPTRQGPWLDALIGPAGG